MTSDLSRNIRTYRAIYNFSLYRVFLGLFKSPLKRILNKTLFTVSELESYLDDIDTFDSESVTFLYENSKSLEDVFDKFHDYMQSKDYLNDAEYEDVLNKTSRKLHRITNISKTAKTPDYIKQGLENYSKEAILKHISK
jgi:hypothetical protein